MAAEDVTRDVAAFILENSLDDAAAEALRNAAPEIQRAVLDRGRLTGTRNPSSAVVMRIKDAKATVTPSFPFAGIDLGSHVSAEDLKKAVEDFLKTNEVDERAADSLRASAPQIQKTVLGRGDLSGARNASSALLTRIRDAKLLAPLDLGSAGLGSQFLMGGGLGQSLGLGSQLLAGGSGLGSQLLDGSADLASKLAAFGVELGSAASSSSTSGTAASALSDLTASSRAAADEHNMGVLAKLYPGLYAKTAAPAQAAAPMKPPKPAAAAAASPAAAAAAATYAQIYNAAVASASEGDDKGQLESKEQIGNPIFVKMRGLPFSAIKEDVLHFFSGFQLTAADVTIGINGDGRPSGEAYVRFFGEQHAKEAIRSRNRERMDHRYIELFPMSPLEAQRANLPGAGSPTSAPPASPAAAAAASALQAMTSSFPPQSQYSNFLASMNGLGIYGAYGGNLAAAYGLYGANASPVGASSPTTAEAQAIAAVYGAALAAQGAGAARSAPY